MGARRASAASRRCVGWRSMDRGCAAGIGGRMITPFSLVDLEAAHESWGCNCGPGAVAAICGLTLDAVRALFGPEFEAKGYTNPTLMVQALRRWDPDMRHWRML